jgi:hypothetical protein
MLEIITLIFLSRKIGELAFQKGLNPGRWKFYTIAGWIVLEFIGAVIGLLIFGKDNLLSISLIALAAGFTSYVIVKKHLDKLPDHLFEYDIDQIGQSQE